MKKYGDLYETEKRRYEEALQRYQENHMDEVEIISLHERCNKTSAKVAAMAGTKTGAKAGAKVVAKAVAKALRRWIPPFFEGTAWQDDRGGSKKLLQYCIRKVEKD